MMQEVRKAVSALEHAVQSSPWALTENYVSAVLEKRGHLALVGAGDPSGRGRAFSFTKDPRRVRGGMQIVLLYSALHGTRDYCLCLLQNHILCCQLAIVPVVCPCLVLVVSWDLG